MIIHCDTCRARYDVSGHKPGTQARCRCGSLIIIPSPPASAGALRCPECGGVVSPQSTHCDFCQASLLVRACPECFARIFHQCKHCPRCGAEIAKPAENIPAIGTTPKERECPRCSPKKIPLSRRILDEYYLDDCNQCGGVFLEAATLKRIIDHRRDLSTQEIAGFANQAFLPLDILGCQNSVHPSGSVYIKCPDCGRHMGRSNFARISGVIVDVCPFHGTWFDAGELTRIVEFVRQGGIERSERKQIAMEKEELRRLREHNTMNEIPSGISDLSGDTSPSFIGSLIELFKNNY